MSDIRKYERAKEKLINQSIHNNLSIYLSIYDRSIRYINFFRVWRIKPLSGYPTRESGGHFVVKQDPRPLIYLCGMNAFGRVSSRRCRCHACDGEGGTGGSLSWKKGNGQKVLCIVVNGTIMQADS